MAFGTVRAARAAAVFSSVASLFLAPGVHAQTASGGVHVVQSGDTLWQIAQDADVDVATLLKLNDLQDGDPIVVGQALKVPAGGGGSRSPGTSAATGAGAASAT